MVRISREYNSLVASLSAAFQRVLMGLWDKGGEIQRSLNTRVRSWPASLCVFAKSACEAGSQLLLEGQFLHQEVNPGIHFKAVQIVGVSLKSHEQPPVGHVGRARAEVGQR